MLVLLLGKNRDLHHLMHTQPVANLLTTEILLPEQRDALPKMRIQEGPMCHLRR